LRRRTTKQSHCRGIRVERPTRCGAVCLEHQSRLLLKPKVCVTPHATYVLAVGFGVDTISITVISRWKLETGESRLGVDNAPYWVAGGLNRSDSSWVLPFVWYELQVDALDLVKIEHLRVTVPDVWLGHSIRCGRGQSKPIRCNLTLSKSTPQH